MSEAHTPGPWHFRTFHEDGIGGTNGLYNLTRVYVGSKEAQSSIWIADCGDDTDAERIANARLIAAAPDLLAALKVICKDSTECKCHGEPSTVDGIQWDDIIAARAAIAKAGGAA